MSDQVMQSAMYRRFRRGYLFLRYIVFAGSIICLGSQRKHLLKWIRSVTPGYLLRAPSPWLTFDAISYLEDQPLAGKKIFEYGSGGSTLYWLSRNAECVSIEHDRRWYETLRPLLTRGTVDCRLVMPRPLPGDALLSEPDDPASCLSSDERYHGYSFEEYVSQIDEFPPEHFDLVLIDGRARASCIRRAVSKVRPGGMLVVDNSERPDYFRRTGEDLKGFQKHSFPGASPSTFIWTRTDVFVKDV
ncbi:hypothetical protein JS756_33035 [Streptomyces actuosus]|uniref:Class I SAM-dependent methyltransferase n=1 Tax=Streptomyces actuosus TaxID=1885 RepID=A0ABS2W0M0_STRAS|nr:hypothetical protein [Streptomyces actuosus]MBN0048824.1 hypothetical protein [Streptomyces actuosus]